MSKDYMMRQCTLKRKDVHQVTWLPSMFCNKIGNFVKLHGEDGWEITSIGDMEVPASWLKDQERNQRNFGASLKEKMHD